MSKNRPPTTDHRPPSASHRPPSPLCWKLTIEYEGTKYHGWQEQANAKTIQGELRKAAEDFFQSYLELGGAGRTDAGVHALAQVAHLKLQHRPRTPYRPQEILFGLNDRLPADICLLDVTEAHPNFHARHDASARSYRYQISQRKTAFAKKYVWWVKDKLDVEAMATAAKFLVGRHDFAAFSKADPARPDESTIVAVEAADIAIENQLIVFRITASHFLWNMVRRLVGALVEVGRGNLKTEDFVALLHRKNLHPVALTAPPSGLFLERITYPPRT
ncbi:MAG: tRNA pseudouridine(38-40) synthase TruA [Blastocatellia bacterium]